MHVVTLRDRKEELKWPSKTMWRQRRNRLTQVIQRIMTVGKLVLFSTAQKFYIFRTLYNLEPSYIALSISNTTTFGKRKQSQRFQLFIFCFLF